MKKIYSAPSVDVKNIEVNKGIALLVGSGSEQPSDADVKGQADWDIWSEADVEE